jgi:hypothetical protein
MMEAAKNRTATILGGSENKPHFTAGRTPDNAFSVNPRPLRLPPECPFSDAAFDIWYLS